MNNLQRFRKENGLTLQALSDMCGVSKPRLHELEKQTRPSLRLDNAYAIAKVLGKTVYEIWPDNLEVVEETITIRRIKALQTK